MEPLNTPLYNEHKKMKALMAPFAGWNMPIHYGSIIDEAKHTRSNVSVFDISHMGEIFVKERPEKSSLDGIITVPVVKMRRLSCRYGFLLNERGGVIDDLIVYRLEEDYWMIVVNAANEEIDAGIIQEKLSPDAKMENRSRRIVKIDVQGPGAGEVMTEIAGEEIKKLAYYSFDSFDLLNGKYIISRTGYTGEMGFEIYIDADKGEDLWQELLRLKNVRPAGLGARDILRLEMGYPLYGHELNEHTTPFDAGLSKFLDMGKEFTGRQALLNQGAVSVKQKLTGFVAEGRRTPRSENKIVIDGKEAGFVTSGVFSPHLNCGIGMGYIDSGYISEGKEISIDTGRGDICARIQTPPFLKNTSI